MKTKRKTETTTRRLPAYWASYLINGDASGMEDDERAEADEYLDSLGAGWSCCDVGEVDFSHTNDANRLGGDVATYTFIN